MLRKCKECVTSYNNCVECFNGMKVKNGECVIDSSFSNTVKYGFIAFCLIMFFCFLSWSCVKKTKKTPKVVNAIESMANIGNDYKQDSDIEQRNRGFN